MTDQEFIAKAIEILNRNGCHSAVACNPPSTDTIYLGAYSYMMRVRLVAVAEEIIALDSQ